MGILVCMRRHVVCYKHPDNKALFNITHIEFDLGCIIIQDVEHVSAFDYFTDYELKCMYYGMTGVKYQGYNSENLKQNVKALLDLLPDSDIDAIKAQSQADSIDEDNEVCYRYNPSAHVPLSLEQEYLAPSMLLTTPFDQIKDTYERTVDPSTRNWPFHGLHPQAGDLATPRMPRAQSSGPATQPSHGSKTGRVWEIAEVVWAKNANTTDWKALRPKIVKACEEEGINSSTASVQYGKWRSSKVPA